MNSLHLPEHDSHDEVRLASGLSALADHDTPPSSISVEVAIGAGRRRAHLRRGGTVLGTAAVVAVAALGAWGLTTAGHGGHSNATSVTESPGVGSDPMTPQLAFGWLPGPATGGFSWSESSRGSNIAVENGTVNVSVTLLPPGAPEPGITHTDGGTVNGQPAVWTPDVAIEPVLAWHYKPNAWAYVLAEGANSADTHKIAETLRIGPQTPIPLPMHLAALPHGFTIGGGSATGTTATSANGGGFILCGQGDCSRNFLTVTANGISGLDPAVGNAPAVVPSSGGHSQTHTQRGLPIFETFSIDGLSVRAAAAGSAVQAIGGESGLTAFVKSMTWYGPDPAKWTTNVIG